MGLITMKNLSQTLSEEDNMTVYACNGACSKCGNCCTNFLPITKKEVSKIKQYVKDNNIQAENRKIGRNIIMQCPFLNQQTKKCSIYEVRPFACKNFLCSHKDWKKRRKVYMQRADYNGLDNKGQTKVYSMDELIYENHEFFIYYVIDMCRQLGGETKENFERIVRLSGREELLKQIKYVLDKGGVNE